jgi:hypothetical protein
MLLISMGYILLSIVCIDKKSDGFNSQIFGSMSVWTSSFSHGHRRKVIDIRLILMVRASWAL